MKPKKNIYIYTWKLEADKIAWQKLGAWGQGIDGRLEGEGEGRKGGLGRAWGSGMVEMEEGQIWNQGRRYLN